MKLIFLFIYLKKKKRQQQLIFNRTTERLAWPLVYEEHDAASRSQECEEQRPDQRTPRTAISVLNKYSNGLVNTERSAEFNDQRFIQVTVSERRE